jgi:lysophospholipase L1-like esterase
MRLANIALTSALSLLFVFADAYMLAAEKLDPGKAKPSKDGDILWFDGRDLRLDGKGWTDTESLYARFPTKAKKTISGNDYGLGLNSTGLRIRFQTDAPTLQVRWTVTNHALEFPHMPATGVSGVDLYARAKNGRWRFVGNGRPQAVSNTALFALPTPPAAQEFMLYLPLYNGTQSVEIGIPKNCTISKPHASTSAWAKPVVFYGSSIVQGGCASRPGMASVAIAGRLLNADTINLGLTGSGRMEPEIADLLAELDPSLFVIDALPNMVPEQVAARVAPFVAKIRAKHPATPILLVEDPSFRNESPTPKGAILHAIFEKLVAAGDKHLYYLSAKNVLGDDCEGTVDGCHPNDLGMMRQAKAYANAIANALNKHE